VRVIFLDIDGVLNSEAFALKLEEKHRQLGHTSDTSCDCFMLYSHVDREAVARLNRLVDVTSAKIVVSSTWRKKFDVAELQSRLGDHGLVGEIIGVTPDGYKTDELRDSLGHGVRIFRGHEIDFWLQQHPDVERFVILDDASDMVMHGQWRIAAELSANIDEHLSRGGALPVAWLGPDCMQGSDDRQARRVATTTAMAMIRRARRTSLSSTRSSRISTRIQRET
jgi:hypothetical protein